MSINALDKAIGFFAPGVAVRRARSRKALERAYTAANPGRAEASHSRRGSANTVIRPAQASLRDKAQSFVRNTPHGPRILDVLTSHVIGEGIQPVSRTGIDKYDKRLKQLWDDWEGQADVAGELPLHALIALAFRGMVEGGDSILRMVETGSDDMRGPIPFALQGAEGAIIDTSRDGLFDGRSVRMGVALGDWDRREGYYLFEKHPDEMGHLGTHRSGNSLRFASRFVERSQVIHLYKPVRLGQVRGITWLAPILLTGSDLADFIEATVTKARREASFVAFEVDSGETESVSPFAGAQDQPDDKAYYADLDHDSYVRLPTGRDIKFAQGTSQTHFEQVMIGTLQAMAAGVGLTYDQVTGDLRQANYSSLRAGKIEFRRMVRTIHKHLIIPTVYRRIRASFIDRLLLAGELRPRKEGYPCDWVPHAPEPIDPLKDQKADIQSVQSGSMTPQQFMASHGRDWREVLADFSEFYSAADARGIALSIDARGGSGSDDNNMPDNNSDDQSGQEKDDDSTGKKY